jgi:hypothetical protein
MFNADLGEPTRIIEIDPLVSPVPSEAPDELEPIPEEVPVESAGWPC